MAIADPTNLGILEDLKFITRYDIFPVVAGEVTLRLDGVPTRTLRVTTAPQAVTVTAPALRYP